MIKLVLDRSITSEQACEILKSKVKDFSNFDLRIQFPAYFEQSKVLRDTISFLFEQNSIHIPWKNRFGLITDEMVNNSIEHGSLEGDSNELHIKFSTKKGKLDIKLEVKDTGRRGKIMDASDIQKIQDEKEARGFDGYLGKRGRGLFQLIKTLVDELYFQDNPSGGLTVGVTKTIDVDAIRTAQEEKAATPK